MTNTITPVAATIRAELKAAGIKARVRVLYSCGSDYVQVFTPKFEVNFTADEIFHFCAFAVSLGLKAVRGTRVDPAHESLLTGKQEWNFYR